MPQIFATRDFSLSEKEHAVLRLLRSDGELFGLQLVARSEGVLKRSSIYVQLHRLEDKGFVESRTEPRPADAVGIPRRLYKMTGLGQRVLDASERAAAALAFGEVLA